MSEGDKDKMSKTIFLATEISRLRERLASSDETVDIDAAELLEQVEKRLRRKSTLPDNSDKLTGLPSKELFRDRLTEATHRAKRSGHMLAVMSLGLDNFKDINNSLGRAVGDSILKQVSDRIKISLRDVDTVARFGGDEFNILLENIDDAKGAVVAANKIITSLAEPYPYAGNDIFITVSIGVTYYPNDGDNYDMLIQNADVAMSRTKELGKNSYHIFTPALNEQVQKRLDMENLMRKAIESHEFVVYYQPKVAIKTKHIIGMEALIRWPRSDGDMIYPNEFIPLAEQTGLIVPIGEQVLFYACKDTKTWRDKGYDDLIVSVNLAARQLDQKNIVEVVKKALEETGLPPSALCLEVTESSMMSDLTKTLDTLTAFKKMGLKVSMDDFGTGYSSLSHLKKFPIDELKIDRSFVVNLPHESDDSAIASTIISMAQTLNLSVIAEGVEEHDQLEFLSERGCGEIQGYLFSPPVPAEKFEELLIKEKEAQKV